MLFAIALAAKAMEIWPGRIEPWRPEAEPPADVRPLLGRWWSEGNEFVFWWEGGALQAKVVGTPAGRRETEFERDGDGWRAVAAGSAASACGSRADSSIWAGYPFTRAQEPFKV